MRLLGRFGVFFFFLLLLLACFAFTYYDHYITATNITTTLQHIVFLYHRHFVGGAERTGQGLYMRLEENCLEIGRCRCGEAGFTLKAKSVVWVGGRSCLFILYFLSSSSVSLSSSIHHGLLCFFVWEGLHGYVYTLSLHSLSLP